MMADLLLALKGAYGAVCCNASKLGVLSWVQFFFSLVIHAVTSKRGGI